MNLKKPVLKPVNDNQPNEVREAIFKIIENYEKAFVGKKLYLEGCVPNFWNMPNTFLRGHLWYCNFEFNFMKKQREIFHPKPRVINNGKSNE
jgi:hypothetical protein